MVFFTSCTGNDAEKGSSNLALIASPASSSGYMTPERMAIINDGVIPGSTEDARNKAYVFWSRRSADTVWVEYTWQEPVSIDEIHLHWADTNRKIALPVSYNIKYRDGDEYLPVNILSGGELVAGKPGILSIEEIETESLRLEVRNKEEKTSALLEWEVISSDPSAKYADLYEETMFNALLGSLDIEGENFYYTNPMTQRNDRYPWHVCPCCVGNIPRTLLMVPT